jgi:hypothetical protein
MGMRCSSCAIGLLVLVFGASPGLAWQPDGVPVCTAAGAQTRPVVIPDGTGGAFVVWQDERSGTPQVYAQRLDADGNTLWASQGVLVSSGFYPQKKPVAVGDGVGGLFVAWVLELVPEARAAYGQRLSSAGVPWWSQGGIPLSPASAFPDELAMISDNRLTITESPGVILAWVDIRSGNSTDIYAQAISSSGAPRWGTDGVLVCNAPGKQLDLVMVTDGTAITAATPRGAILAWVDERAGSSGSAIYAQRLNTGGIPQWTANGVAVTSHAASVQAPVLAHVGPATAIVAWPDGRANRVYSMYAQQVGNAGSWNADGVPLVPQGSLHSSPAAIPDGAGGVIVTWSAPGPTLARDIIAQRLDGTGTPVWPENGVVVCDAPGSQQDPVIVRAATGEAVIAWLDPRDGENDVYAQKLGATGARLWSPGGIPLCRAPGFQFELSAAGEPGGGAIIAWSDYRSGVADIYAQRVSGEGGVVDVASLTPASLRLSGPHPNPGRGALSFRLELAEPAEVSAVVMDVAGRRVRSMMTRRPLLAGSRDLRWDGADDAGLRAAPGIYWLHVDAGDRAVSRRAVLVR